MLEVYETGMAGKHAGSGAAAQPFDGVRIVDLTHVIAGPFASYQLALLGADVIKVEAPDRPDPSRFRGPDRALAADRRGLTYQVQGANKRSISLDLRDAADRAVFLALIDRADVFLHNLRGGALDALDLGDAVLAARNPALIRCAINGFGASGGRAGIGAYDNGIQAAAGIVARSGGQKPGLSMIDYAAGWNAALAISAALHARARDGFGRAISVSMLETALMMMAPEAAATLHPGDVERPAEAGLGCYDTRDGRIMLGAFTPDQNARLWRALAKEGFATGDFADLAGWEDLFDHAEAMTKALRTIMPHRSAEEWEAWLHDQGLPGERVRTLAEGVALALAERPDFFVDIDGVRLPTAAFTMHPGGPEIRCAPPAHGADSVAVRSELDGEADA